MMKLNRKKGQAGFVVTVELLLIVTVLVVGLLTGWTKLRDQTVSELSDAGAAIGSIDNSYEVTGLQWDATGAIAKTAGFGFQDASDPATGSAGNVGGDSQFIDYITGAVSTSAAPAENMVTF